jgi:branched-chain amino acid transport system substrate-binding protein
MKDSLKWLFASAIMIASASTTMAADKTGITGDKIKIGVFGALSGESAVFAKGVYGAAAVYKDINDHGGIHGRKLELVVEDDACDAKKAAEVLNKLIEKDKVFAINGGWCSGALLPSKDYIAKSHVPFMILASASGALSTPVVQNIFHPVPTSKTIGESIVTFALSKPNVKNIAIVTQSDEGPFSKIRVAQEKLKSLNITPVKTVMLTKGLTDATAEVRDLKTVEPDAILISLYPPELAVFLRDAYKEGLKTTFVATESATLDDTYKRVGIRDAMKDLYFFYPFGEPLTAPGMLKYANIFKKYYPSENLDMATFQGMGGALAVVEALRRSGHDLSRERFISELNKLQDFKTPVTPSPLTFSATDHVGIKSGKFIYVSGNKQTVTTVYPTAVAGR